MTVAAVIAETTATVVAVTVAAVIAETTATVVAVTVAKPHQAKSKASPSKEAAAVADSNIGLSPQQTKAELAKDF